MDERVSVGADSSASRSPFTGATALVDRAPAIPPGGNSAACAWTPGPCVSGSSGLAHRSMRKAAVMLTFLLVPAQAMGHVTVWPQQSLPGAYEKYAVRVPNEKLVATVRIEASFPPEVRVMSFQEVPGWTIEPKRDASGRIVGATWLGSLPPERFVEFPLIAANPKDGIVDLTWSFLQIYADGSRVEWTGAPGSKSPASVVTLRPTGSVVDH